MVRYSPYVILGYEAMISGDQPNKGLASIFKFKLNSIQMQSSTLEGCKVYGMWKGERTSKLIGFCCDVGRPAFLWEVVPHHWVTGQNVQSIQQQSSNDMVSHPTRM
jgi:hypothetical protein